MNPTIPLLSFRNLIRQRRKNLLLGAAIAFGTMTLIVATSFVAGITDTLFNRVIVYMTGHIELNMSENGSQYYSVHRRPELMKQLIERHITGIKEIREGVAVFGRGIGNGKSDNILMVGVPEKNNSLFTQYDVVNGDLDTFNNRDIRNPIVISESKARYLRLKVGDTLRVRLRTINGQQQSVIMNVVAIVKSTNMFLEMASYARLTDLKTMLGYQQSESGSLQIILENPSTARRQADRLHRALTSPPAWIQGSIQSAPVWVSSFKSDVSAVASLNSKIKVVDGNHALTKKTVLMGRAFAIDHGITVGSQVTITYPLFRSNTTASLDVVVTGLFEPRDDEIPQSVILIHPEIFFGAYYAHLPRLTSSSAPIIPCLSGLLVPEWILQDRSHTSEELKKKNQDLGRLKLKNAVLDVRTMEETASNVLTFDAALRTITYSAVALLFVIILIGIVNSLRMNIRERTREIGTMRAIGMQPRDIVNLFLYESLFLAVFSTMSGYILAIGVMRILSLIPIVTTTPIGIFLVNHHLYFLTRWDTVIINISLISFIVILTTYFPARAAAKLECVAALSHSEG